MISSGVIKTDIVLLGAGHANLEVLRRFAMRPEPGVRLTLIGREPETLYSGMLPGLIRGDYAHHQTHIDLVSLAAAAGARFTLSEATAIDLECSSVIVSDRPKVEFDLLSIDVGGTLTVPGDAGLSVKPIGRFLGRLRLLEATLPFGAQIAVVGGGPAGVELVLALTVRFAGRFRLVLISADPDPIFTAPRLARIAVRHALVEAGVELICGVRATALEGSRLSLSDGRAIDVATALWATGVEGPGFLVESGLSCDRRGCIRVDRGLRSISHAAVFAAGDCAALDDNPRPKGGVWAVRAGVPLAENLRRAARGQRPKAWQPQRNALVILGLGRGKAVGWRNGLTAQGREVWWLKDRLDRRWIRRYATMRMLVDPAAPMRCGGCGAKVGADVLSGALGSLSFDNGPDLVIALGALDDGAVLRPPAGKQLVQSVDHFRAFLDDPFVFGQIAAAHSLSDLHAMGAAPWTALAIASVPYASGRKMRADLSAMMLGATEVLRGDGCVLVGGHSAEATEPALGFAVTGLVDPSRVLRKTGLQPGDQLILTKKLGTGIVLAGHMRGLGRGSWLLAAITSMRTTNRLAAAVGLEHHPTAGTDITGFGLAGHLCEMLEGSVLSAVLWAEAIQALPGARDLAAQGVESTLAPANRRLLTCAGNEVDKALLIDPQTSGGLLLGLPASKAAACLTALCQAGLEAAIIGTVAPARQGGQKIRIE